MGSTPGEHERRGGRGAVDARPAREARREGRGGSPAEAARWRARSTSPRRIRVRNGGSVRWRRAGRGDLDALEVATGHRAVALGVLLTADEAVALGLQPPRLPGGREPFGQARLAASLAPAESGCDDAEARLGLPATRSPARSIRPRPFRGLDKLRSICTSLALLGRSPRKRSRVAGRPGRTTISVGCETAAASTGRCPGWRSRCHSLRHLPHLSYRK